MLLDEMLGTATGGGTGALTGADAGDIGSTSKFQKRLSKLTKHHHNTSTPALTHSSSHKTASATHYNSTTSKTTKSTFSFGIFKNRHRDPAAKKTSSPLGNLSTGAAATKVNDADVALMRRLQEMSSRRTSVDKTKDLSSEVEPELPLTLPPMPELGSTASSQPSSSSPSFFRAPRVQVTLPRQNRAASSGVRSSVFSLRTRAMSERH